MNRQLISPGNTGWKSLGIQQEGFRFSTNSGSGIQKFFRVDRESKPEQNVVHAGGVVDKNNSELANFDSKSSADSVSPVEWPDNVATTDRQRVEAILLMSRTPIPSRKLAQLADLADATQARTLARELNDLYNLNGHAFRIEEIAGGYLMMSRPQFAPWLRKSQRVPVIERQNQSALETLAVVAYRQPVARVDVEAIRGVGCDEILKQLMELDLVRICGRSEDLGRPYLYGTTKRFLQLFGLKALDRLPRSDWVKKNDSVSPELASDNSQPSTID